MEKKRLLIGIIAIIVLVCIVFCVIKVLNFLSIKDIKINRHEVIANEVKEIEFNGLKLELKDSNLFTIDKINDSDTFANIEFSLEDNSDFGEFWFEYVLFDDSNTIISTSFVYSNDDKERGNVIKSIMYNDLHTNNYLKINQESKGFNRPVSTDIYNTKNKNYDLIYKAMDESSVDVISNCHLLITNIRYNKAGEPIQNLSNEIFEFTINK